MYRLSVFLILFFYCISPLMADRGGNRGAFTRGGWSGARYIALGMTGVVMADDIFSMYWNPAGLSEMRNRKKVSEDVIAQKAGEGNYGEIDEADLLYMSETGRSRGFFSFGASYTHLDLDRDAFFGGCAFGLFQGVLGFGAYSIVSGDIETRDSSGSLTGKAKYGGTSGFLSYAWSSSVVSMGISLKPLYEKIENSSYVGLGSDFGVQIFLLPFIKVGVMARDLGSFLKKPGESYSKENIEFFNPEISGGISFLSDSGLALSAMAVKRLEQKDFYLGGAMEYEISPHLSILGGIFDNSFTAGFEISFFNKLFSYALSFDRIDGGYNSTISMEMLF